MSRLLALIAALLASFAVAWWDQQTPDPQPATAPATAFSSARAANDIAVFALTPHPIGSAADHAARDDLVGRMSALGLSPRVEAGSGIDQPKFAPNVLLGGSVENIVGVLPGRDHSLPALALMAHYDSVPASPGASDDAAGVSAALEVVRAIKARGTPARDVMVLLTDGEEAGLLGADAFFRAAPDAKRIGFIINMEARGSSGRVQMFQTSVRNDGEIRLFAARTPRPTATSLAGFIYEHMPNDTDFTVSKRAGVPGLNYAFAGGQFDYHAASSTPAAQDRGTLQDMGDQVLATAGAIAASPSLPSQGADLVYAEAPGGLMLTHPFWVGWALLAAAALLTAAGFIHARRAEAVPLSDLARGAGAALFAVITGVAVLHLARKATGAGTGFLEQRFLLAQVSRWEVALILLGVGVLLTAASEIARGRRRIILLPFIAGLGACLFGGLDTTGLGLGFAGAVVGALAYGRPASRAGAWTGALVLGLLLACVAQTYAPPAAYVLTWPVAWASLAAALTAASTRRGLWPVIVLTVFAIAGLAFAGGLAHSAYLSLDLVELLGLPLAIAAWAIWPLAQTDEGAPPARLVGPALILIGLAVTLAVRFNHPYDARHPRTTEVVYEIDQDAHRAWRTSYSPDRDPWTVAALTADGGKIERRAAGPRGRRVDSAPAPFIETPAPQIVTAKDPAGALKIHVVPPPGGRVIDLVLKADTAATLTGINGVSLHMPLTPGKDTFLRWSAAQAGVDLTIRPGGPGKLTLEYSATIEQWPATATALPRRPADVTPFDVSDSTSVEGSRSFSW